MKIDILKILPKGGYVPLILPRSYGHWLETNKSAKDYK